MEKNLSFLVKKDGVYAQIVDGEKKPLSIETKLYITKKSKEVVMLDKDNQPIPLLRDNMLRKNDPIIPVTKLGQEVFDLYASTETIIECYIKAFSKIS